MSVTNDIFSIIENGKEEYDDEIRSETRWEFFYHLSRLRKAALIWYPIDENARVLEIGCGFGAMTGLLCDKAAFVDHHGGTTATTTATRVWKYQIVSNANVRF